MIGSDLMTLGDIGIVLNAPPVGWNPETPVGFTGEWYGYDKTETGLSPEVWWNLLFCSIPVDGILENT